MIAIGKSVELKKMNCRRTKQQKGNELKMLGEIYIPYSYEDVNKLENGRLKEICMSGD